MGLPSEHSRLLNVPIVTDADGRDLCEVRTPLPYLPVVGMSERVAQEGEQLWHIAFAEYGNGLLWWAIADFNDIHDPFTEVASGRTLLIPPRSYIDEFLSTVLQ
jgi:nucleoid-associated protein YgaU